MTYERIAACLGASFESLPDEAAHGLPLYRGKVRDVVRGKGRLLLVASDRISAFDRVLSSVPYKGEVLARIAAYWFEQTADIVPNHVIARPARALTASGAPGELVGTGRATLVAEATMLPLEVVVRGYLAGSSWRDYQAGRPVSGIALPRGLACNEKFPVPIITPSRKAASGHDEPVSRADIIAEGLVSEELWREVERVSLALFRRGQELASRGGLILADTKYEFGLVDGRLTLCDEIHTPDSSRYWWADSYRARFEAGEPPRELDKEPFRRWLLERGFRGEGEAPRIPDAVRAETAWRYIQAYEAIVGEAFEPIAVEPQAETALLARIVEERLLA